MKLMNVEASWEIAWPVNWDLFGIVFMPDDKEEMPEFLEINGVKYQREN